MNRWESSMKRQGGYHRRDPRDRWIRALTWMAIPVGIAAGLTVATVASAASVSAPEVDLGERVLERDVPAAWDKAVRASTLSLPEGHSYPHTPPSFFEGILDTQDEAFANSLFNDFVGLYSYCSWLGFRIDSTLAADARGAELATAQIQSYFDSLSSDERAARLGYLQSLEALAKSGSLSEQEVSYADVDPFVYDTECTGFEGIK